MAGGRPRRISLGGRSRDQQHAGVFQEPEVRPRHHHRRLHRHLGRVLRDERAQRRRRQAQRDRDRQRGGDPRRAVPARPGQPRPGVRAHGQAADDAGAGGAAGSQPAGDQRSRDGYRDRPGSRARRGPGVRRRAACADPAGARVPGRRALLPGPVSLDPAEFESEMRRQLVRQKIESLVRNGVKVSDAELREAYGLRNERVRAAWASVDVQPLMATVTAADSELDPYVKAHRAQFTRPERRRLQYVVLDSKIFPQPFSDQEVEAYYTEHSSEFEQPRRVHVAHVLVRVPPVGGSEAENKSKAKVEAVIKRAQAGEDFAKLAKEVSEDTANAGQGGDLGFVAPGDLMPQFEQPAFALKKGEVSPAPVRTPLGYHAIKVLDSREGGKTPLKEAAAKIKDKLSVERSDSAARARADAVRAPLMAAKDFAAEAKTLGLEARETTIARGEALEGIGREPGLEEAVFSLALGGVSAPTKTRSG